MGVGEGGAETGDGDAVAAEDAQVLEQAQSLWADHVAARDKEAEFYAKQDAKNAEYVAAGEPDKVKVRSYTGKPTFGR